MQYLHIEQFSDKEIYNNLSTIMDNYIACYRYNPNRDNWYVVMHKEIKETLGYSEIPMFQLCGVVSALSPQLAWSYNIISAKCLVDAYLSNTHYNNMSLLNNLCQQTTANILKAIAILESDNEYQVLEFLNSPKTQNFFANLLCPNDYEYVTIDRHMINASGLIRKGKFVTTKQYNFLAGALKIVSQELKMIPCHLQSIIWENIREHKGVKK